MKKLFWTAGLGLALAASSAFASVVLPPTGVNQPLPTSGTCTAPCTVLATGSGSGTNGDITVSVIEYVVLNGSVVDFYYEVTNSASSGDNVANVQMQNFKPVTPISAENNTATVGGTAAGTVPSGTAALSTNGSTVTFNFGASPTNILAPGQTSDWLEIDTTQANFMGGATEKVGAADGTGFTLTGNFYGPAPEPATLGLLGGGLALLGVARWRRNKKA